MFKLSGIVNGTALAMTLVAGCATTVEQDGRDDAFLSDGKADSAGVEEGTPEALGVLDVANKVSIEVLEDGAPKGVGLSSRAVDNLMYYRLGDDGLPGTKDDGVFQTLAELDAIPFIGPVAFERLRAYAEANGFVDSHRTAINITFDGRTVPSLVAVRDGLSGTWRLPEAKSGALSLVGNLTYQARVGARYTLAIVCEDVANGQVSMYQEARTLDEAQELFESCDFTPGPDAAHVTGTMQQAGFLSLGTAAGLSTTDDWAFDLVTPAGTYDLVAASADRVAIRRALAISGNVALAPKLDLAQEGTALAPIALTAANATATETVSVDVRLSTSSTFSAAIYRGAPGTARIAPGTILAANDRQTASVRARDGGLFRALRRPINATANTAFTLPPPVGERYAIEDGRFAASWGQLLPGLSYFSISADATNGSTWVYHSLDLSPAFIRATGINHAAIDTNIPGFKPEWTIDFAREYYRSVFVQGSSNGELSSISNGDSVNGPAQVAPVPTQAFTAPVRSPRAELPRGARQP